ncbi:hypothetical protein DPMN_119422 [Dreissena polymorpha]|uniref:Uncharacterized protein n=1 Tax=Dreissena polymorpha TaxID=45954 RepID=A0A9D4JMM6_DREPO|nr:hypothetical protein DPMN_119346 [Dreissena polymorpha]KAH3817866.1 hypothetical protein DPMN_119422 [Dreissena polymorpha]
MPPYRGHKKQANINAEHELLKYQREAAALANKADELTNPSSVSQNGSVIGDFLLAEDSVAKVNRFKSNQSD